MTGIAKEIYFNNRPFKKPIALIFGEEITLLSKEKEEEEGIKSWFLIWLGLEGIDVKVASIGTDGIDGNSPAAGGIISGKLVWEHGDEVKEALRENDSYAFLKKYGLTIETGPTFTNLNDVTIVLIK